MCRRPKLCSVHWPSQAVIGFSVSWSCSIRTVTRMSALRSCGYSSWAISPPGYIPAGLYPRLEIENPSALTAPEDGKRSGFFMPQRFVRQPLELPAGVGNPIRWEVRLRAAHDQGRKAVAQIHAQEGQGPHRHRVLLVDFGILPNALRRFNTHGPGLLGVVLKKARPRRWPGLSWVSCRWSPGRRS